MQSEKSKKAGNPLPTTLLVDYLKTSYGGSLDILVLEEDMNFNLRTASLSVSAISRDGFLLNSLANVSNYLLYASALVNSTSACSKLLLSWIQEVRQGGGCLLVSTDIAARGVDLPETTHIYNFDLPRTAVDYLHRAGRTGRKPFSDEKCYVTNIITPEERFVLERYENELMFNCEQLI